MLDLLFFALLVPVMLLWSLYRLAQEVVQFFGWLLGPAVLLIYAGVLLFIVGPAAPDAVYESVFQSLSETVVQGVRLPSWLLIGGFGLLLIGAGRRTIFRRREPSQKL